jgi:presenilin-like A22 family membrane protease
MGLNNLRAPDRWMSIVTAVLLAGYFAIAVNALLSPSSDPQRGMADGFIILVALILLFFGGALWFGVARNRPWVIRIVFVVTVLPAISQLAQSIFLFVHHAQ